MQSYFWSLKQVCNQFKHFKNWTRLSNECGIPKLTIIRTRTKILSGRKRNHLRVAFESKLEQQVFRIKISETNLVTCFHRDDCRPNRNWHFFLSKICLGTPWKIIKSVNWLRVMITESDWLRLITFFKRFIVFAWGELESVISGRLITRIFFCFHCLDDSYFSFRWLALMLF